MNPRDYGNRNVLPIIFLGRGMLIGLFILLPGMVALTKGPQIIMLFNDLSRMPVIAGISDDFKTGVDVAGDLFRNRSNLFYRSAPITVITDEDGNEILVRADGSGKSTVATDPKDQVALARFAWRRDSIKRKLSVTFGPKMMHRVEAYLNYIEKYRGLACMEMAHSYVPASISLAQGLLESNAGQSHLAINANNHFGIKCSPRKNFRKDGVIDDQDFKHHSLAYDCLQRKDDYKWDRFEMYKSPELSFRRHTLLLTKNKRYNWMLDKYFTGETYQVAKKWFGTTEVPYYAAWSIGLKKGGYATNRRYAQKLAYIIETYELWRVDYTIVFGGYKGGESNYALD